MKLSTMLLAFILAGAAGTAASAATYDITLTARDGTITGVMTVDASGLVTSFTGTASGFGGNPVFNGAVELGQGAGGPVFLPLIDNKFSTTPDYFSAGDCCSGGGLGLVTAAG